MLRGQGAGTTAAQGSQGGERERSQYHISQLQHFNTCGLILLYSYLVFNGTGSPFTVQVIIYPLRINLSGNGG